MKAIITDLDRTLLRTDRTISAYTCAVLKRCRDRGEDAFSNKPIPEWNDSAFDGFPALPTDFCKETAKNKKSKNFEKKACISRWGVL